MNMGLSGIGGQGGLSLLRILGSLSKTVGIVRQIAPIYNDIKPLLAKAPLLFERINSIRNAAYTIKNLPTYMQNDNAKPNIIKGSSGPVFFQ